MSLNEYRKESLRKTASKLGVSSTFLHDIENGRRLPSYELLKKLKSAGCYEKTFFDFFEVITIKKVIPKMV